MSLTAPEPLPLPFTARRFFTAILDRKLPIALFVFAVAAVTVGVALWMTPWYAAEATLLPPTESADPFANLAGMIENSALNRVGLFSTSTPSDVYVEILKSRRLGEALIRKYDLDKVYKTKGMDRTLRELSQHMWIKTTPSGVITIRTEATSRQLAADMANFLVADLDRFNRETLNTKGKSARQFLEARLADVEKRMRQAEAALTSYEQKHKVVVAGDDAAVRGIADVMSQKLGLQVKRSYVESYAPGSPAVREIDAELSAFDRELAQLPILKNEGSRLALEAQIQHKLFALVTAQYEDARLQELRDTPTVTVLDEAQPPEIRARPKRTIMVVSATAFAGVLALAWVAFSMRRQNIA